MASKETVIEHIESGPIKTDRMSADEFGILRCHTEN